MNKISQEYLKEILSYDKETGIFKWKIDIYSGRNKSIKHISAGDRAGTINGSGYLRIGIDKKSYLCQHLAWIYEHGEMPKNSQIDHENHIRHDNRIKNLRIVTNAINQKNVSKRKDNQSGFTGVNWHEKSCKWVAQIQIDKKKKHLGYFSDFYSAVIARKEANIKYGFHLNHGASNED